MTPDPTDNRATAERIAREVYDQYSKDNGDCYFPLSSQGEDDRERAILCVLAGMAHRDRTAERIAPFTLADAERYVLRMGTTNEQDIVDAVNDDRKHRDREAVTEAIDADVALFRRILKPFSAAEWGDLSERDQKRYREAFEFARRLVRPADRTAEREAASKALGYIYGQFAARPVVDKDVALAVVLHALQSKEGYLAAEFDAGERVTLSDGSVVELDPDGVEFVRRNIARSLPRVAKREHWPLLVTELTGADFDAVKRLAEQRGAER